MKYPEATLASLEHPEKGSYKIGPFGSSLKKDELVNEGIPVIGIENILSNEFVPRYRKFITDEKYEQLSRYSVQPGDVLITTMGTVGRAAIVPDDVGTMIYDSHLFRMRVDQKKVFPKYLTYALNDYEGLKQQINQKARGAIMAGLNTTILKECTIPLPPLGEQRRIAAVLDKADALRAKRRTAVARLDALLQSTFLHLFGDPVTNPMGWPFVELKTLIRRSDRINYGVVQPGDDYTDGISLIRVGDFVNGEIAKSSLKKIDPVIERKYQRSRLIGDEILIACVGSIGNIALADESLKGFNIARAVARVPLHSNTRREYIAAYLRTRFVQTYFENETRTVSQPTLNIKQISETPIMAAPKEMQDLFAENTTKIRHLQSCYEKSLAQLDNLFHALQQRAFNGEL